MRLDSCRNVICGSTGEKLSFSYFFSSYLLRPALRTAYVAAPSEQIIRLTDDIKSAAPNGWGRHQFPIPILEISLTSRFYCSCPVAVTVAGTACAATAAAVAAAAAAATATAAAIAIAAATAAAAAAAAGHTL